MTAPENYLTPALVERHSNSEWSAASLHTQVFLWQPGAHLRLCCYCRTFQAKSADTPSERLMFSQITARCNVARPVEVYHQKLLNFIQLVSHMP